jgi:hypothetical protein
MKFDPAMMQALLALDDAALWKKIRQIAAQGGFSIAEAPPPPGVGASLASASAKERQLLSVISSMVCIFLYNDERKWCL